MTILAPAIGIDIDGTMTELPVFYSLLIEFWPGPVHIITYRKNMDGILQLLRQMGVDPLKAQVHCVPTFADKAKIIKRHRIKLFIDDMDEVIQHIPMECVVLKARNDLNFEDGKWLYDAETGRHVGQR